jgi:hypothetical protein
MTETKDLTIADTRLEWTIAPPQLPEVKIQYAPRYYAPSRPAIRTPSKTDVNGIIEDAVYYFENGGTWCQNSLGNDDQVCLVGSLLRMETGDPNDVYQPTQPYRHPLTTAAVNKLSEHLSNKGIRAPKSRDPDSDPNFDRVSHWNDAEGRTKEEVISLLKEVVGHGT